jgi:hypothetical protein
VQDAGEIGAIGVEACEPGLRGRRRQQRLGDQLVALPQQLQLRDISLVLAFGEADEVQERVRDALARGQHQPEPRGRLGFDDVGDAAEAGRVGDAGATELVNDPRGTGFQAHPLRSIVCAAEVTV